MHTSGSPWMLKLVFSTTPAPSRHEQHAAVRQTDPRTRNDLRPAGSIEADHACKPIAARVAHHVGGRHMRVRPTIPVFEKSRRFEDSMLGQNGWYHTRRFSTRLSRSRSEGRRASPARFGARARADRIPSVPGTTSPRRLRNQVCRGIGRSGARCGQRRPRGDRRSISEPRKTAPGRAAKSRARGARRPNARMRSRAKRQSTIAHVREHVHGLDLGR